MGKVREGDGYSTPAHTTLSAILTTLPHTLELVLPKILPRPESPAKRLAITMSVNLEGSVGPLEYVIEEAIYYVTEFLKEYTWV